MDLAIIEHIQRICGKQDCAFFPKEKDPSCQCYGCADYRDASFMTLVSTVETEATESLKFVGSATQERYTGDNVDCFRGDIILVSKGKKVQLLKDHPDWFQEVVKSKAPKTETPAEEKAPAKKKDDAKKEDPKKDK